MGSEANVAVEAKPTCLSEVNALLGSMSVHMVLLILLGLMSSLMTSQPRGDTLTVQLGNGPGNLGGDAGTLEGAVADELSSASSQEMFSSEALLADNVSALALATDIPLDVANLPRESHPIDKTGKDALDKSGFQNSLDKSSSRAGKGGRGLGDQGDGTGGGGDPFGTKGGFFGIGNSGRTIVYVVDSSGSMEEHGKFKQACKELMRSVSGLSPEQKYFIVLYSDGAYPMDADGAVPATSEQIEQTREWLSNVVPNGGTQPLGALMYALSLKPDEIYFLSDGIFDANIIQQLKQANPGQRVPIHTIAFTNFQTVGLMKMIARHSGGKFRFVQ